MKLRSVILIIIGILFFFLFFFNQSSWNLQTLFLGAGLCLVTFIYILYVLSKDIKDFIETKSILSFSTTFIGIAIVIIISIYNYMTDENRIPVVLYATHSSGVSHCGITLRNNGRYYFYNGSPFGMDQVEGKYFLKDSIITIEKPKLIDDKADINLVMKGNRLLIKSTLFKYDNDTITHVLCQIGNNDKILDSVITFVVFQDNRVRK